MVVSSAFPDPAPAWWPAGAVAVCDSLDRGSTSVVGHTYEEFLFRSVLLPKVRGVFGKWDWLANAVLFATYHWHQPWGIPGNIVSAAFLESLPTRRFRTVWISIIIHSAQSVFFLFLILGLVLGLA